MNLPSLTRVLLVGGPMGGRVIEIPGSCTRLCVGHTAITRLDLRAGDPVAWRSGDPLAYDVVTLLGDENDIDDRPVALGVQDGARLWSLGMLAPTFLRLGRDLGCVHPVGDARRWQIVDGRPVPYGYSREMAARAAAYLNREPPRDPSTAPTDDQPRQD